jgi:hypothetical protein
VKFEALPTEQRLMVALVLNRFDLLREFTMLEAANRLGMAGAKMALAVQKARRLSVEGSGDGKGERRAAVSVHLTTGEETLADYVRRFVGEVESSRFVEVNEKRRLLAAFVVNEVAGLASEPMVEAALKVWPLARAALEVQRRRPVERQQLSCEPGEVLPMEWVSEAKVAALVEDADRNPARVEGMSIEERVLLALVLDSFELLGELTMLEAVYLVGFDALCYAALVQRVRRKRLPH